MATLRSPGERDDDGVTIDHDVSFDGVVSASADLDLPKADIADDYAVPVRQGESAGRAAVDCASLRLAENADVGVGESENPSQICGEGNRQGRHDESFAGITMEVIDGALVISGAREVLVRSGGDDVVDTENENRKTTFSILSSFDND